MMAEKLNNAIDLSIMNAHIWHFLGNQLFFFLIGK